MTGPVKISVVVPTFRRLALLRRLLEALKQQTFSKEKYEVIVISDGPDCDTEQMVSQLSALCIQPQIKYHSLQKKYGPAAARNAGWQMSTGELIVFTDDDCIPDSLWLEAFYKLYLLHPRGIPLAFTGKVIVPVSGLPTDYEKNVTNLSTAEFITANCACNRSALNLVGGFDETFPVAWREDSDLQFRLLRNGIDIQHVPKAVVCHPVRKARWGVSIYDQQKSMFNALLFKKHPDLYKKRISSGPVWSYYIIILLSFTAITGLLSGAHAVFALTFLAWLAGIIRFTIQRLKGTDKSPAHRLEMFITSLAIPYLSVFWTLRGAWKYKVFFL